MYRSDISTILWWIYDIPGNIGWILYGIGFGRFLAGGGFSAHRVTGLLLALPVLLMLTGIIELVSERFHKLDRELPALRFWRGFGALTAGGLAGCLLSLATMHNLGSMVNGTLMLIGGALCFVFAGLIALSFRKQK